MTCCSCYRMSQNAFFIRTRDLLVSQKTMQRHFSSTLHPLSPVIFATATVMAFVLLRNSRFNFHCYTQREATPTQKSARKGRSDLSRLLARKMTKRIHSSKPASLNRPIHSVKQRLLRNRPGSDAATSCEKDYSGRSLVQTSFTETPYSVGLFCI